jgi:hypothetical protein
MTDKKTKRQITLERSRKAVMNLAEAQSFVEDVDELKKLRKKIGEILIQVWLPDRDDTEIAISIPDFLVPSFRRCIIEFAEENADKMDVAVKQALLKAAL